MATCQKCGKGVVKNWTAICSLCGWMSGQAKFRFSILDLLTRYSVLQSAEIYQGCYDVDEGVCWAVVSAWTQAIRLNQLKAFLTSVDRGGVASSRYKGQQKKYEQDLDFISSQFEELRSLESSLKGVKKSEYEKSVDTMLLVSPQKKQQAKERLQKERSELEIKVKKLSSLRDQAMDNVHALSNKSYGFSMQRICEGEITDLVKKTF